MDNTKDADDFTLEVTDLRTGQRTTMNLKSPPARESRQRTVARARSTFLSILAAFTHHSSSGVLRVPPLNPFRLACSIALVLLLLITTLVVGSNPGAPAALYALIHLPFSASATDRDTAVTGQGSFIALNGVPWGVVLIDGRPDLRANIYHDIYQGPFTLPPGRHTIEYHAAPFPSLRCVVTVPISSVDTCPLVSPQQAGTIADPYPPATRLLDLRATPAHLPPTQQAALATAIQIALAERAPVATTTVLPGERYVIADGSVAIATHPLRATFLYEFQWDAHTGLRDCSSACAQRRILAPYYDVWIVSAHIRQGWRYIAADGMPVVPFAPPIASNIAPLTPSGVSATDIFINLYIRWSQGWQVSTLTLAELGDPYTIPTCAIGFEALLRVLGGANVIFTPIAPSRVANGCLFRIQRFTSSGALTGRPLYYFYRFGVLLAVNAPARAALPALPAASTAEQALAHLIASQAGQPSP